MKWLLTALLLPLLWLTSCTFEQVAKIETVVGINNIRQEYSLPPVVADVGLSGVAQYRAQDMASKNYFSHTPPDGCDAFCLIKRAGLDDENPWQGEIIAYNQNYPPQETYKEALLAWKNSPPHLEAIVGCHFERVGVGLAISRDGKYYYVAIFGGARWC